MSADKISLVRWRDAKTDPPEIERDVMTDVGLAYCWGLMQHWEFIAPDMEGPCEPSVWCDPSPPDDDALTVDDLRAIAHAVLTEWHLPAVGKAAKRLRRAIEEAER